MWWALEGFKNLSDSLDNTLDSIVWEIEFFLSGAWRLQDSVKVSLSVGKRLSRKLRRSRQTTISTGKTLFFFFLATRIRQDQHCRTWNPIHSSPGLREAVLYCTREPKASVQSTNNLTKLIFSLPILYVYLFFLFFVNFLFLVNQ